LRETIPFFKILVSWRCATTEQPAKNDALDILGLPKFAQAELSHSKVPRNYFARFFQQQTFAKNLVTVEFF